MASKSVRLVRAGDIVTHGDETEVVRSVSVIFNLANGEVVTYPSSETVEVHDHEDLSALIEEELEVRRQEDAERERVEELREQSMAEQERRSQQRIKEMEARVKESDTRE